MLKRYQALAIFCCSLLGFLSIFGCSGGGGGGTGNTSLLPPQTVTLQGRVDEACRIPLLPRPTVALTICKAPHSRRRLPMAAARSNSWFP